MVWRVQARCFSSFYAPPTGYETIRFRVLFTPLIILNNRNFSKMALCNILHPARCSPAPEIKLALPIGSANKMHGEQRRIWYSSMLVSPDTALRVKTAE